MRLRIFLIEPNDAISGSLQFFLEELGHEVVLTASGDTCPFARAETSCCPKSRPCADAVIIGQYLPKRKGIDLIEQRHRGGCKVMSAHVSLLCLPWSDGDRLRAEALGCRYFESPLRLTELADWLQSVTRRIDPQRQLAPLETAAWALSCPAADGA